MQLNVMINVICEQVGYHPERSRRISFPETTMIGALADYISSPNENFQPMNSNFGILPPLEERIKDKRLRYEALSNRSLAEFLTN